MEARTPDYAGRLREWRLHVGMSQRELAVQAGLHPATVMKIESGATQIPSWRTLRKLAARLGISPRDLIRD